MRLKKKYCIVLLTIIWKKTSLKMMIDDKHSFLFNKLVIDEVSWFSNWNFWIILMIKLCIIDRNSDKKIWSWSVFNVLAGSSVRKNSYLHILLRIPIGISVRYCSKKQLALPKWSPLFYQQKTIAHIYKLCRSFLLCVFGYHSIIVSQ